MSDLKIEQPDAVTGLRAIFHPRSVAVIGAGRDPTSMSGRLFRNLQASFRGPVYPINPRASEIAGTRTFPSILNVPRDVDLAVVAVPAASVLDAVRQCIEKKVRGLVVITAGFSECGEAGKLLERELLAFVRQAEVRMVGPNCFGVFNTDAVVQLQATFASAVTPAGNVGVCTQSGALGVVIPDFLRQWNLGVSTFASIGNHADVSENDLLAWWRDDAATDVVMLYLESFHDARAFRRLATQMSCDKPIVALKAARTQIGARAASSHTAALAGPDRAADALFRQSGVVRVETIEELFDVTALLASQPLPRGRSVAILTNAGGPGIVCADALAANGLMLPEASRELQLELRRFLRLEAGVKNPIDLIGTTDAGEFRRCLDLLMDSREFDAVITIYVPREPGTSAEIARVVREVTMARGYDSTSLAVFMQTTGLPRELGDGTTRVPGYLYPEAAARALACAVEYAERRRRAPGAIPDYSDIQRDECRRIVNQALFRGGPDGCWLEPQECQQLLTATGLSVPRWKIVHSADEAAAVAREWATPVVVKVVSPSVLHKTDVGGVVIDLRTESAVRKAYQQVLSVAADARGVLIQEFTGEGKESFIGATRDPRFGHLITFGCGGVLVELMDAITCRLHPLTDRDAEEMIRTPRTLPLLTGYRGQPAADIAALEQALLRVSALLSIVPEIAEMDLNPIKVLSPGGGSRVVDPRIRVAQNGSDEE